MTAQHTPGPWLVGDTRGTKLMVYSDDALGSRVADCSTSGHGITLSQDEANVRLIAAAPDLLALAKQYASECGECNGTGRVHVEELYDHGELGVEPLMQPTNDPCPDCADIRAVIAKAEGRS